MWFRARERAPFALALILAAALGAGPARAQSGDVRLGRLADEFLDHWLASRPQAATRLGLHDHDGEQVPAVAARCRDPRTQADLAEADSVAVEAIRTFISYLQTDVLPRSTGTFALGRETYQKKLLYDEMEETPVDSLLAHGWQALR